MRKSLSDWLEVSPRPAKEIVHWILLAAAISEIIFLEVIDGQAPFYVANIAVILAYCGCLYRVLSRRWVGFAIGSFGLIALALSLINNQGLSVPIAICWTIMHCTIAVTIMRRVFSIHAVRIHEILDAVTIFLLVGMTFTNLYFLVTRIEPLALIATADPTSPISFSRILYFSFVTQLTVGYGDVVANASATRALSVMQALFGVLYISIFVARFVAIHTATAAAKQLHRGDSRPPGD